MFGYGGISPQNPECRVVLEGTFVDTNFVEYERFCHE